MIDNLENADVCLSGGAIGSDLAWGRVAENAGHGVIHFGFHGHKSDASPETLRILSAHDLLQSDIHCALANKSLKRHWPPRSLYTQNLLRRNWYQVADATSCYAISTFGHRTWIDIGNELENVTVKGGTAWAVQMFIDRHDGAACLCYVFDQDTCNWFKWQGKWMRIYEPPKPCGKYAGVGTRDLNNVGNLAIEVLMDYKQDFHGDGYPMKRSNESLQF